MSTDYLLLKKVPACDFFDGRLEDFGIREVLTPDKTTETNRFLTDGRNYVWVYIDDDGNVISLTRRGNNAPGKILNAVAKAFDTDIVSEYEPQYWGFDTQEEWDAACEKIAKEHSDRFHNEILKFLKGEPHDIKPGTIGMIEAEIAKRLVEKDPALLLPINEEKFRREIQSTYDRDHSVTVTLGPREMALVKMIATHEDDLPQG